MSALRAALAEGPHTIVALGPLTNIANALRGRPHLVANVTHIIAVMGKREGHVFHPAEGRPAAMLNGHGPVFRDLNATLDTWAAQQILSHGVPVTMAPYALARQVEINPADLARIANGGRTGGWVAKRARPWLAWWRDAIGRDGFYPFDLIAVMVLLEPDLFVCAPRPVWVDIDRVAFGGWGSGRSVMIERAADNEVWRRASRPDPVGRVVWCSGLAVSVDRVRNVVADAFDPGNAPTQVAIQ
ncbi:MAG: nucleoside hydrolase [Hyphomicrobiales bacterium]|nr:nucleoside hydrolase [Hyphomicrobiales bacterium]